MHTCYFTAEERALFERLPREVRDGWSVEEETGTFVDTPERQAVRFGQMRLKSRRLRALQQQAPKIASAEELERLIDGTDLSRVPSRDLMELFFALGPNVVTAIIADVLPAVRTTKELRDVAFLTTVRRHLFTALAPSPASR